MFNVRQARELAGRLSSERDDERGLTDSFVQVCQFIADYPGAVTTQVATLFGTSAGLETLAKRYFKAYRKTNVPAAPSTVPDDMVDVVMQEIYRYTAAQCVQVRLSHQHAMSSENCVGALLERYLDSVLRPHGWHWCCGSMIRAVDFIHRKPDKSWLALQIKNRDNSENSSSSAIRAGTEIQKWHRTFSRSGKTNWERLPPSMRGYELGEEAFVKFVRGYLRARKA